MRLHADGADLFLCDALGRGPAAAPVADLAEQAFRTGDERDLELSMRALHEALQGTRGAAIALASLPADRRAVVFLGVGNIASVLVSGGRRQGVVSNNGVVGHVLPRMKPFVYEREAELLAVFHSDGLQARWSLDAYPGLWARHPALIAGVLYRDFRRSNDDCPNDDCLVVAARSVAA